MAAAPLLPTTAADEPLSVILVHGAFEQPTEVDVNEIVIRPTAQSF